MNILIDASAIIPILINEPEKKSIITITNDCELVAPSILPYEIGNALTRLKKRKILDDKQVIIAYNDFKKIPLRFLEIDIRNALKIACENLIYAYDAYYLEIAWRLNLPLLTLDGLMKKIALNLNIKILERPNESV
ncbi:MAG: type II toxin-antitoxin system VapC family toxin [Treponema sp.]|nr:type II toxin-antitoxin system VapC family toxin [Treponema sp.]